MTKARRWVDEDCKCLQRQPAAHSVGVAVLQHRCVGGTRPGTAQMGSGFRVERTTRLSLFSRTTMRPALLMDGINTYQYRADGLMTASTVGNTTWSYTYDAQGQRLRKDDGSSANEYIYFSGQLLAMRNPSTGVWTDRIYGPTGALATVPGTQSGSPVYRVADHLGSLNYTLDASGNIIGASSALPYGQINGNTTGDNTFVFTDHERDSENQTDATRYRHYISRQGRWISPDPSNGSYNLLDPQSLNRYSYLNNRPMAQVDRLGLDGDDDGDGDGDNDDDGDIFNITWSFFSGLFGSGGDSTNLQSPPPDSSLSSVASDGLAATTQPNGGSAYISITLWANSSVGSRAWAVTDASPGLDIDGQAVIPTMQTRQGYWQNQYVLVADDKVPAGWADKRVLYSLKLLQNGRLHSPVGIQYVSEVTSLKLQGSDPWNEYWTTTDLFGNECDDSIGVGFKNYGELFVHQYFVMSYGKGLRPQYFVRVPVYENGHLYYSNLIDMKKDSIIITHP